MPKPLITLLTDFGLRDHYVAAMKGVMLQICPELSFVDISHEVEAFHIQQAAWTLSQAWKCFPAGTVHLVVVDPGVGSARLPLAGRAGGHLFVGPDNGVLSEIFDADPGREVYGIDVAQYARGPVSSTFHGRDIFAPVAARLAAGLDIARVGRLTGNYARWSFPKPVRTEPGCWTGAIVSVDRFGNLVTNFDWNSFEVISEKPFEMRVGSTSITTFYRHYAEAKAGEYFVIKGSAGFLEVSMYQRDAAASLNVKPGLMLNIRVY